MNYDPEYLTHNYMRPSRDDTRAFKDMHVSRNKFLTETRTENDKSAFAWLLDWRAQLSIVLVFGIISGISFYLENYALGWGFIGILIILSSAFVCFRIVLPALKWLVGLVD